MTVQSVNAVKLIYRDADGEMCKYTGVWMHGWTDVKMRGCVET